MVIHEQPRVIPELRILPGMSLSPNPSFSKTKSKLGQGHGSVLQHMPFTYAVCMSYLAYKSGYCWEGIEKEREMRLHTRQGQFTDRFSITLTLTNIGTEFMLFLFNIYTTFYHSLILKSELIFKLHYPIIK